MSPQTTTVNLIIGRRKTGKTDYCMNIINNYPNRVLVVDTFKHPKYVQFQSITLDNIHRWQKGIKHICINDNEDEVYHAINQLTHCLIVFEDASKYTSNEFGKKLKAIVLDSKQKNNDIIFMFHGFAFIHPKLLSNSDGIILFRTAEKLKKHEAKIPLFDYVAQAYLNVNSKKIYNEKPKETDPNYNRLYIKLQ
jgi:23S rRNA pseudoU1915 N3-methylase RlmH